MPPRRMRWRFHARKTNAPTQNATPHSAASRGQFQAPEQRCSSLDRDGGTSAQQTSKYATIHCRQRLEVIDRDSLVELVNRCVDRTQLDDFRADVGDEAPVGGAARAG